MQQQSQSPSPCRDGTDVEIGRGEGELPVDASNPDVLVRSETWWINFIRVFLIGTLVVVAIGISATTYKLLANLEYASYRSEFNTAANRVTQAFLQDMKLKMWVSSFVTTAISKNTGANGEFLDANKDFFDEISAGVGDITYWNRLAFSPLLWTQSERLGWEEYARQQTATQSIDQSKICHVCGEGMEVGSPDNLVNIPSFGTLPCGAVEKGGMAGNVPPRFCPYMPLIIKDTCSCQTTKSVSRANKTESSPVFDRIFRMKDGQRIVDNEPPPYSPVWEASPEPPKGAILYNQMSDPSRRQAILAMIETKLPTFTLTKFPNGEYQNLTGNSIELPQATIFYPVFGSNNTGNHSVVGSIAIDLDWSAAVGFANKMPPKSAGVLFVIENTQGQTFSFQIGTDHVVNFVGEGDLHDPQDEAMMKSSTFEDMRSIIFTIAPKAVKEIPQSVLVYRIRVYPSGLFKSQFVTYKPIYYAAVVALAFVFTSAIFIIFDLLVRKRQTKVMDSVIQSKALVSTIFPEFIASRLMRSSSATANRKLSQLSFATPKHQLRNLLGRSGAIDTHVLNASEPIADLFSNVTVIFADIAGFTAWCSERDPEQVFQLLETVYQKFDKIAIKHGVFKIETIGDCYVAATGLPTPQTDHAVRMSRFAFEILLHMQEMAASLESLLGPGTGSLTLRVGLHSGSVTGGVLRGDKARFQLFGDTMNTAARMQTTGLVNTIQASEATASLLVEAGFSQWVTQRLDKVLAKGKGDMQTFWINLAPSPTDVDSTAGRSTDTLSGLGVIVKGASEDSYERLINWNSDLLELFLKKVVAARSKIDRRGGRKITTPLKRTDSVWEQPVQHVTEVIEMSDFCETSEAQRTESVSIELDAAVLTQLRNYVECIASMYRDNPFHNFEHASHVAMSAKKIIKRIVKPECIDCYQESIKKRHRKKAVAQLIHSSTFGISSDVLMQFAAIFSALIHDVDHAGVSNAQLVKERKQIATTFHNKCVAEQHSICTAWNLLMEDRFSALRACICSSVNEERRFQQLVVNAVIATDIADNEFQVLRRSRWYKAFYEANRDVDDCSDDVKATIAFEYIIQASDVAHTMQHWHVYIKWNEKLFEERYIAFLAGREETDPSVGWYDGEIGFFDNYVIPLARKLETCGVFGVSSDEYLNYALTNRNEWERQGRDMVEQFEENSRRKHCGFDPHDYHSEGGIAA